MKFSEHGLSKRMIQSLNLFLRPGESLDFKQVATTGVRTFEIYEFDEWIGKLLKNVEPCC